MYGPLLQRRNLLLVDQRGTGLTDPIRCPSLQHLVGPYAPAAATCAAHPRRPLRPLRLRLSADDLSAVIRALRLAPVDLYGDSYGTFFAQVFLGRHRTCSAASSWTRRTRRTARTAWYATQGPAMRSSIGRRAVAHPPVAATGPGP